MGTDKIICDMQAAVTGAEAVSADPWGSCTPQLPPYLQDLRFAPSPFIHLLDHHAAHLGASHVDLELKVVTDFVAVFTSSATLYLPLVHQVLITSSPASSSPVYWFTTWSSPVYYFTSLVICHAW